jgi:hypothetical protein
MPSRACIRSLLVSSLFIVATTSNAQTMLSTSQMDLIRTTFPNHVIQVTCEGNFTGNSEKEIVVALRAKGDQTSGKDIRAAIVDEGNKPILHNIDEELTKDSKVSSSAPLNWIGATNGTVKCGANPGADPQMSDHGKLLGHPPFFKLPVLKGVEHASAVCFATSNEYNNWDCVAYDRKQRRFRLWYQQSFAD